MFFTKNLNNHEYLEHFFDIMDEQILHSDQSSVDTGHPTHNTSDLHSEYHSINSKDYSHANSQQTNPKKRKAHNATLTPLSQQPPERCKSSYLWFVSEKMEEYKSCLSNPGDLNVVEVMKSISSLWKELPASERLRYEDIAHQDKQRYHDEMHAFTIAQHIPKKHRKASDAPKRSMSAFLLFSQKMRSILHKENPQLKNTEISTILSQRWKALTEEEKKPFVEQELVEREKYHQNMKEYREKMVHEKPVLQPGNQNQSQQGSAMAAYSVDDSLSSSVDYNANNMPYALYQAISAPYSMYPSSLNTSTKSNSTSSSSMTPSNVDYNMMNYQGYNMLPNCPYPPIYPYPVPCNNNNTMNTNNTLPYLMNPEVMMNEEYISSVMFANPLEEDNQTVTSSSTSSRSIHSHGSYYTANNTQTPMSQQPPSQGLSLDQPQPDEEEEVEDSTDYNVIAMNIVQAVRHAGILP